MRSHETTAVVGVGVAACAACCAGPILAFLAAIGLGTVVGYAPSAPSGSSSPCWPCRCSCAIAADGRAAGPSERSG
jgi:hypothetical protein